MRHRMTSNLQGDTMKRIFYYFPSILVLGIVLFVLTLMGEPSHDSKDYLAGTGILLIILLSDFLLSGKIWYGCMPGMLLGAYVICCSFQYHGQVLDEMPIGLIVCGYYLVMGIHTANGLVPYHNPCDGRPVPLLLSGGAAPKAVFCR